MTISCITCGEQFDFGEGEQKFFDTMGFTYPKRCKPCRQKKKKESEGGKGKWNDKRRDYGDNF